MGKMIHILIVISRRNNKQYTGISHGLKDFIHVIIIPDHSPPRIRTDRDIHSVLLRFQDILIGGKTIESAFHRGAIITQNTKSHQLHHTRSHAARTETVVPSRRDDPGTVCSVPRSIL